MKINAYSAYHLYCLFNDLHNVYKEAQIEINKIMGTEGLAEKNGKYLIANVSKEQWFRIIEFAQKHDCYLIINRSLISFIYLHIFMEIKIKVLYMLRLEWNFCTMIL